LLGASVWILNEFKKGKIVEYINHVGLSKYFVLTKDVASDTNCLIAEVK